MLKIMMSMLILGAGLHSMGQEITFDKSASLEQVYMDTVADEALLPMNDVGMETGYLLYQTSFEVAAAQANLILEHVRDYAAVYVDGKLQGTLTDARKSLVLNKLNGIHQLQIYVENIGRITYGPEILDNAKGLFGEARLDGAALTDWVMIPLAIKKENLGDLRFDQDAKAAAPRFFKGSFSLQAVQDTYLDISGWGMGEVWINNSYLGTYWEQEKQQSLHIAAEDLVKGENVLIVFELKDHPERTMKLAKDAVFK
ncbi:hypothetical protein [Sphingobacterium suaedae]|uniref:Beta-galactosidase n=1 Tax=Sphingobacterium suaedae TaxID=1686402 RepID=A0ABW5KNB9_9SPHI